MQLTVDLEAIAKWIGAITAILIAIWRVGKPMKEIVEKLNRILSNSEASDLGMRTLLKYRLMILCPRVIHRGWMTPVERATIQDGLKAYRDLKGNGEVEGLALDALKREVRHIKYEDYEAPVERVQEVAHGTD